MPLSFWRALASANTTDGTLGRYFIFETPCNYPDNQEPADLADGMDEIVEGLKAIAAEPDDGYLINLVIEPRVVPMDDNAQLADRALRADQLDQLRTSDQADLPVLARFREQVRRIALIAAVADNPASPVCTAAHYDWATKLARHCQQALLTGTRDYVADTPYEALLKRVLGIIRRHDGWMSGHDQGRKPAVHGLPSAHAGDHQSG